MQQEIRCRTRIYFGQTEKSFSPRSVFSRQTENFFGLYPKGQEVEQLLFLGIENHLNLFHVAEVVAHPFDLLIRLVSFTRDEHDVLVGEPWCRPCGSLPRLEVMRSVWFTSSGLKPPTHHIQDGLGTSTAGIVGSEYEDIRETGCRRGHYRTLAVVAVPSRTHDGDDPASPWYF